MGSPLPWVSNALATPDAPISAAAPHSAKTKPRLLPRLLMVNPPGSPDQLNQVYKLGAAMPSREVAKSTGRSPLVFRVRQTVRLFLSCRDTAIIASPQTTEGFDAKDSVGAGDVRRARGGLRSLLAGRRPFWRRGPITHRLKKLPVGGPGPRCPWGRTWVCGPYGCGCAPCGGRYWYRPWRY